MGFTAADVRELYELRELLEPAAAALATARASDEERAEVTRLAELTARRTDAFETNREFHRAALRAVRQRARDAARSTRSGRIARRRASSPTRPRPAGAVERMAVEHAEIARAYAARDAARVQRSRS